MDVIIRGTTPTLKFTFSKVDTAEIVTAYLVIKQLDEIVVEKNMTAATIAEGSVSWTLTQSESLSLKNKVRAGIYCDWVLSDGTRGRSKYVECNIGDSGKNEVI